jgi:hypothetical protein
MPELKPSESVKKEHSRSMGCEAMILIYGTGLFVIGWAGWWFFTGHASKTALYWYLFFAGFFVFTTLTDYIASWRNEVASNAKKIEVLDRRFKEINARLNRIEQKLRDGG